MFKNYFIIAWRKMMHQKMYSIINIGGMAIGIACFLLISVYVRHEMSFDKFHKNCKHIYRVYRIEKESSGNVKNAATPHALPKALLNDYPDLKNVVSVLSSRQDEIKVGENVFQEKILFASPNFFDVFDFPFVIGSQNQLSQNIHSIIITKRLAKKLFGDTSPTEKTLTVHKNFELVVAGVIEDVPANSSFQFDAFICNDLAYRYIFPEEETKWYSMGIETFVEFSSDLSPLALKSQFPEFLNKYLPDFLKGRIELGLQPLKDIHTNTEIRSDTFPAVSENVPGSYFPNQFSVIPEGGSEQNRIEMVIARNVSEDFFNTYQMYFEKGRNFSKTMSTDQTQTAIINETAAKQFGWDNPIGKHFRFAFAPNMFTVVGMIQDIHFHSLQNKVKPLIFVQYPDWGSKNFITARVHSNNIQNSLAYLKQEWNKLFPTFPFEYHFVDDMYRSSYKNEEQMLQIVSTFAVLAIVLASLGLLGLTTLIALKRTKEIGIRKTLGASVSNILLLLSRDSIVTVIIASFITLPIGSYVVNDWLQNFPYRIKMSWWMFALAGALALVITLLTVSWQAIRAARANPIKALRYE